MLVFAFGWSQFSRRQTFKTGKDLYISFVVYKVDMICIQEGARVWEWNMQLWSCTEAFQYWAKVISKCWGCANGKVQHWVLFGKKKNSMNGNFQWVKIIQIVLQSYGLPLDGRYIEIRSQINKEHSFIFSAFKAEIWTV